jgi:hypothetical protein
LFVNRRETLSERFFQVIGNFGESNDGTRPALRSSVISPRLICLFIGSIEIDQIRINKHHVKTGYQFNKRIIVA